MVIWYDFVMKIPSLGVGGGIPPSLQAKKKLNIAFILKSGTAIFSIYIVNREKILTMPLKNTR